MCRVHATLLTISPDSLLLPIKVRKKRVQHHQRPGTGSSLAVEGGMGGSDATSTISGMTYGTATTFRTKVQYCLTLLGKSTVEPERIAMYFCVGSWERKKCRNEKVWGYFPNYLLPTHAFFFSLLHFTSLTRLFLLELLRPLNLTITAYPMSMRESWRF